MESSKQAEVTKLDEVPIYASVSRPRIGLVSKSSSQLGRGITVFAAILKEEGERL